MWITGDFSPLAGVATGKGALVFNLGAPSGLVTSGVIRGPANGGGNGPLIAPGGAGGGGKPDPASVATGSRTGATAEAPLGAGGSGNGSGAAKNASLLGDGGGGGGGGKEAGGGGGGISPPPLLGKSARA